MSQEKLLIIMPSFNSAGAERVTLNILNFLDRKKYDLTLLIILEGDYDFLKYLNSDIKIEMLDFRKSLKFSLPLVFKKIKQLEPNTIFVGTGHLGLLLSPFIPLFKKFNWVVRETNFVDKNVKNKLAKIFYKIFYNNFNLIIAQCNDMKNDLVNNFHIQSDKIKVINNPVDTGNIQSKIKSVEHCFYDKNKINLVACGRLTWQKGFESLIHDFSKVPNIDKYHLTIIGEGEGDSRDTSEKLNNLVKSLEVEDYVSFVGHKKNIYPWLFEADVFILSSLFEGFPNILLEAICCGIPVLSNDCPGGIRDIVLEGENGCIYCAGINFNEKLNEVLDIKKIKNENNFYPYIENKFGTMKIISDYEKIL